MIFIFTFMLMIMLLYVTSMKSIFSSPSIPVCPHELSCKIILPLSTLGFTVLQVDCSERCIKLRATTLVALFCVCLWQLNQLHIVHTVRKSRNTTGNILVTSKLAQYNSLSIAFLTEWENMAESETFFFFLNFRWEICGTTI